METINHTSIQGRPVVDIITETQGYNKGKLYAIAYGSTCKHTSLIEHYGLSKENFPLHRIIKDYIAYHGIQKAVEILIGKGIINTNNRPIVFLPGE